MQPSSSVAATDPTDPTDQTDKAEASFERMFQVEVLASERIRVLALVVAFVGYLVLIGVYALLRFVVGVEFAADVPIGVSSAIMVAIAIYEVALVRRIQRAQARGEALAPAFWYVNAFVEISVPSVAMVLLTPAVSAPLYVLSSPAFALYFLFITLSTLRLDPRLCLFVGVVAALEYTALCLTLVVGTAPPGHEPMFYTWLFYLQRALLLPITGLAAGFVAREIRRRSARCYEALEERGRVLTMFGQHTSPAIVDELLRHPADVTSRRQRVCIMFLDIRGFTSFSEQRPPEDVVAYLNELFEVAVAEVNRARGVIHQLLGDGFMAIFGAPLSRGDDCQNAVDAALAIVARVEQEVARGRLPATRIGIGLHAGEALTGVVGTSIHREYKVTGDVVNLAARIEQLNKRFDSRCLISGAVRDAVSLGGREVHELGEVEIRGRSTAVRLYRLA